MFPASTNTPLTFGTEPNVFEQHHQADRKRVIHMGRVDIGETAPSHLECNCRGS
jgi:hypothetical protein